MQCWVLLLVLGLQATAARDPGVDTTSGRVEGARKTYEGNRKNGDYWSFQGIPYAEPPVGLRRFQDPAPLQPWLGVKDCSGGPPSMCPQMDFFNMDPKDPMKIGGSEDCLFLNIYTSSLPSDDMMAQSLLRPVMFYIHGGGFTMGSGAGMAGMNNSGEDYLLESGMVVVSINYRLGPLGFLALPGTNIQGNMGMKDQLLALRWVKANIARFGGDPGRITIAGLSAGGMSVHGHVLSPMGKDEGLFHRAIAMSGTLLMTETTERGVEDSRRFFEKLCDFNSTSSSMPANMSSTCLFTLPAEDLVKETLAAMAAWGKPMAERIQLEKTDPSFLGYAFWVVVDDFSDNPFLPSHPITILHNQQQKMVPFMTGVTTEEGAIIAPSIWKDMDPTDNVVKDNWGWVGTSTLFQSETHHRTYDLELQARMVAHFYVGKDGLVRENKQGLMDMITDAFFAAPNHETIKLHAKAPPPVYSYLFSYKGSFSFSTFYAFGNPNLTKEDWGVAHGDDGMYFSRMNLKGQQLVVTENDKKVVDIYQKLITNFARYGDPTPVFYADIAQWPPAQKSRAACVYMDINLEPQEKHRMFADRTTFWHMLKFRGLLEKYAVDKKEARMLIDIETAIEGSEEDSSEERDDHDDSSEEKDDDNLRKFGRRNKIGRWNRTHGQRRNKMMHKWKGRGGQNKVARKAAKLEAHRRRRLAKKLRSLME